MIVGTGIDVAEVPRIAHALERFGDRFLQRVYTETERRYALRKKNPTERLAARFAAKEAGMKALGTGLTRGVRWRDLEVINLPSGRPTLQLHGVAAQIAQKLGVTQISLSITHSRDIAMAHVIMEAKG